MTVRLTLVLSVVLKLHTRQVDYILAFVQAELKEDVYCEMPEGFSKAGCILLFKKSVYGLRQSPLNWFKTLSAGLKDLGLLPSGIDQCLFISPSVICVVYVDDCLLFSRDLNEIEKVVDSLGKKLDLGYEDTDVAGFLGIQLQKNENGTIELKQTGLIDRITATMGLDQANGKHTPAEFRGLAKDGSMLWLSEC
jgi:hypothetical protein